MLVDYIRVYQNPLDDKQSVGCSTDRFPTAKFIEAHKDRYMESAEVSEPLLYVPTGGSQCKADRECGGSYLVKSGNNYIPHEGSGSDLDVDLDLDLETVAALAPRGRCVSSVCVCSQGFTGPSCKASNGFNDNFDDSEDLLHIHGIMIPTPVKIFALIIAVGLIIGVVRGAASSTGSVYNSNSNASNASSSIKYNPINSNYNNNNNNNNNINNNSSSSDRSRGSDLSRGPYQAISRTEN